MGGLAEPPQEKKIKKYSQAKLSDSSLQWCVALEACQVYISTSPTEVFYDRQEAIQHGSEKRTYHAFHNYLVYPVSYLILCPILYHMVYPISYNIIYYIVYNISYHNLYHILY